jgi:hypothetical protein
MHAVTKRELSAAILGYRIRHGATELIIATTGTRHNMKPEPSYLFTHKEILLKIIE